jgi:low temperature requirement protein LtrA
LPLVKLPQLVTRPVEAPHEDSPVTMLELFFDLVFVFVITQVTTLISAASGWAGYGRAALVLLLTWYIYNGFAWLTNNVAPTTLGTRLPMFAAMACFPRWRRWCPTRLGPAPGCSASPI